MSLALEVLARSHRVVADGDGDPGRSGLLRAIAEMP